MKIGFMNKTNKYLYIHIYICYFDQGGLLIGLCTVEPLKMRTRNRIQAEQELLEIVQYANPKHNLKAFVALNCFVSYNFPRMGGGNSSFASAAPKSPLLPALCAWP